MKLEQIKTVFAPKQRKEALKKALLMKNPVLTELALQVTDDISGLETSLIKHKIEYGEVEYVDKILKPKMLISTQFRECVDIALMRGNKDMLQLLFERGASTNVAMTYSFRRANLDHILLLIELGCEFEFEDALKTTVEGASKGAYEVITWLFNQATQGTIRKESVLCVDRYARIYGKDRMADHILKCFEEYKKKFAH